MIPKISNPKKAIIQKKTIFHITILQRFLFAITLMWLPQIPMAWVKAGASSSLKTSTDGSARGTGLKRKPEACHSK